jgi:hypothetical protein
MAEAPDWFQTPPLRRPDPEAALTVHAIRGELASLADLEARSYAAADRERRIRRICERRFDLAEMRQIAAILDERKVGR